MTLIIKLCWNKLSPDCHQQFYIRCTLVTLDPSDGGLSSFMAVQFKLSQAAQRHVLYQQHPQAVNGPQFRCFCGQDSTQSQFTELGSGLNLETICSLNWHSPAFSWETRGQKLREPHHCHAYDLRSCAHGLWGYCNICPMGRGGGNYHNYQV